MIIDTLRPDGIDFNNGWSAEPSGTLNGVTSDDNDSTYALSSVQNGLLRLTVPAHSLAADHERHQIRARIRARSNATTATVQFGPTRPGGGSSPKTAVTLNTTIADLTGSWSRSTFFQLASPNPIGYAVYARRNAGPSHVRAVELYVDIDTRNKPTFDTDVLDAAGVSRDAGTITDTNRPTFTFTNIDYDGLVAREWELRVVDSAFVPVYETGRIPGMPPESFTTDPLPNDDYVGFLRIWSTIRNDDEFASDAESVAFEIDFVPPPMPVLTATVDGCESVDGPHIEVCWVEDAATGTVFDDEPLIELWRYDCNGGERILVQADSREGCWCDRFAGLAEPGFYCGDPAPNALRLNGSVSTAAIAPDSGPLSVTGDLGLRVIFDAVRLTTPSSLHYQGLVNKLSAANISYSLAIRNDARLLLEWHDTSVIQTAVSTDPLPDGTAGARADLDVDNGAGGWTATFFYTLDRITWLPLGDPVSDTGTTQIEDGNGDAWIGNRTDSFPFWGHIRQVEIYSGPTLVADPDFTAASPGDTTVTDGEGNVWTLSGDAEIAPTACMSQYQARYWGLVNDALIATDWTLGLGVVADNPNPGEDWMHGAVSGDIAVCPDRSYGRTRPFGAFQPIGGGLPTVVTGSPGGRDYTLTFPVTSEADLVLASQILAQPLFFYQPSDQADLWLAPDTESVRVVKVGRIREVSVSCVAVEPQPTASPESFFTT